MANTKPIQGALIIRPCIADDFDAIWSVINDGARAYAGVIPPDRWKEPYMSREELCQEIEDGVVFWLYEEDDRLLGVMGVQAVQDVTLIRHAYVRLEHQGRGIGSALLSHLKGLIAGPCLVGTWATTAQAIGFYQKHGYRLVSYQEKEALLRKYWNIPVRQIEASVVLKQ